MSRTRPVLGQLEDRHRPATGDLEQRNAPSAAPTVEGRRVRGLIPYGIESRDLGGFREVIEPGALDGADLTDLIATVDHGGVPIARHPGTLTVEDRADGFAWALELPESRSDVREAIERGDLCAGSWRMVVARDRWEGDVRHVEAISELRDVSVVSTPAYAASIVEHRSAPDAPPAGPTPGPTPRRRGGLRVEERTATSERSIEARVLDAVRSTARNESRSLTRATADPIHPDDLRAQIIDALRERSVVVASGVPVIPTDRAAVKAPLLTSDVTPAFYDELETITPSDPGLAEFEVPVKALKALTIIGNETVEDSDPSALQVVLANHLAALALKGDREMLAGQVTGGKGINGLLNITGAQTLAVNGALTWDAVLRAAAMLEAAFVPGPYAVYVNGRALLPLDLVKAETGSNQYAGRPVNVPPVYTTSHLPVNGGTPKTTVVVAAPNQLSAVVRSGPLTEVDRSVGFDEDATHVRSRYRLGFGAAHPQAIVKLTGVDAPAI